MVWAVDASIKCVANVSLSLEKSVSEKAIGLFITKLTCKIAYNVPQPQALPLPRTPHVTIFTFGGTNAIAAAPFVFDHSCAWSFNTYCYLVCNLMLDCLHCGSDTRILFCIQQNNTSNVANSTVVVSADSDCPQLALLALRHAVLQPRSAHFKHLYI